MKLFKFDEEILAFKQVNTSKYILIGAGLMLLMIALSSFIISNNEMDIRVYRKNIEREVNLITNNTFTKDYLVEEIKAMKFNHPDIIMAQAMIETTHFKSPVFRENHNVFGMRLAMRRTTLANGHNLKHATYDNWKRSVQDRKIYDALYLDDLSRAEYMRYLDKIYAEGSGYSTKLEKLIVQYNLKEKFKS